MMMMNLTNMNLKDVREGICSWLTTSLGDQPRSSSEVGLKRINVALRRHAEIILRGHGDPNLKYHNYLTTQPSLFQIRLVARLKQYSSEIPDHGQGDQEAKTGHTA